LDSRFRGNDDKTRQLLILQEAHTDEIYAMIAAWWASPCVSTILKNQCTITNRNDAPSLRLTGNNLSLPPALPSKKSLQKSHRPTGCFVIFQLRFSNPPFQRYATRPVIRGYYAWRMQH
jgi:hypothetical protein